MKKEILLLAGLFVVLVLADRLTKLFFYGKYIFLITFTKNTGALFGLFKNNNLLFIISSFIALIILIYFLFKTKKSFLNNVSVIMIISGIVSNLIDRLYFGYVIDFIDLKIWPIFNLADVFILAGIIIFCIESIRPKK